MNYWHRFKTSMSVAWAVYRFMMHPVLNDEIVVHFGGNSEKGTVEIAILTARGEPAFEVHRFTLDMERKAQDAQTKTSHIER